MPHSKRFVLLATAFLVTTPLVWFGIWPDYFVHVVLQPSSEVGAQILSKETLIIADGNGVVFFDFKIFLPSTPEEIVFLEIRPAAEPNFYRQGNGYKVTHGVASGIAQLGSPRWPLHQNEKYTFRLLDAKGSHLLDGKIVAEVIPRASASPWLIVAIGLLAAVLQLVHALSAEP